jgi:hypothetical protein
MSTKTIDHTREHRPKPTISDLRQRMDILDARASDGTITPDEYLEMHHRLLTELSDLVETTR